HWFGPAFDGNGRERNAVAFSGDAISELVIIGEAIGEGGETADFGESLFAGGHDCAESRIDWFEALCLEDLAPEVGVDSDSLPMHGGSGRVGKEVEAVNEADGGRGCRGGRRTRHPGLLPIGWGEGVLATVKLAALRLLTLAATVAER